LYTLFHHRISTAEENNRLLNMNFLY